MKEPFEIKVYEIDDVERLQRRKEGLTEVRRLGLTSVFYAVCMLIYEVNSKSLE